MRSGNEKNIAMIAISAIILVLTNSGIWLAVREGAMAPADNGMLWSVFMILNAISIIWAIVLLGVQPMVVAISYVAGGFLAYKGVEGLSSISAAEITTAGATYGAFGALVVGNVSTKVRFKFYNSGQVPFIFMILGLLVLDAVLGSGISRADGGVILNAVVFPFVLAGVIVGLIWAMLNRFGIGYNPRETIELEPAEIETEEEKTSTQHDPVLTMQIPEQFDGEEEMADAIPETITEPEIPQMPSVREAIQPAAASETQEDEFFPLEIDNDEEFVMPNGDAHVGATMIKDVFDPEEPLPLSSFVSEPEAPIVPEQLQYGAITEDSLTSFLLDVDEEDVLSEEQATPDPDEEPIELSNGEEKSAEEQEDDGQARPGDWLSSHLDLLNKLK